jgi:hypothetical protein
MTPSATLLPDNLTLAMGTDIPAPDCPICGGPTYYKTGYYQKPPHSPFFSCIKFPKCLGSESRERAGRRHYNVEPDPDEMDSIYDSFLYDAGDRD